MDIGVLKDEEEAPCAEGLVPRIRAATTALGRLWILDNHGRLSSFDRALEHRQLHLVDKVVDVMGEFDGSLEWIHVGGPGRRTTQEAVFRGPITDVVVDPTDRRCVIASEGLVHFGESGRVVRSCPGDVSVILEAQAPQCGAEWQNGAIQKERQTVPFFNVIANRVTVYAIGQDETYAITGRVARRLPPPLFAEHCRLSVAHVEGLTFIRDPRIGKQYRDVIDIGRFAVPAL
jgi:hypothetical protein